MKYVAFIRGIGPENPNMHGTKLREFFESLGFKNVRSFISSGNVLFESDETNVVKLETEIENELPKKLGFSKAVIIRSKEDLEELISRNPFPGLVHSPNTYLNVTFLKYEVNKKLDFPMEDKGYRIVQVYKREICFIIDQRYGNTPYMMSQLEKTFDKKVTTRTWNTVIRINALLEN